ncbi:MAG: 1-acyl-sn-glycerol-3-phosphate acyltransferase [Parvularculaceae bacterium]
MGITPWPVDASPINPGQGVLFIIVGEDAAEQEIVRRWLDETRPADFSAPVQYATVSTGDDELIHKGLEALGDDDSALIVAPVSTAWAPKRKRDIARSLRDILIAARGAPKSAKRKTRIARESPDRWRMLVGEPANLERLKTRFERRAGANFHDAAFADFVARQAVLTVDRERRKGPDGDIKLPRFVAEAILARKEFRAELAALETETGKSFSELEADALKCLKEIAPSPSPFFINLMGWITHSVCAMGYDEKLVVDEASAQKMAALVREKPTAFLFTHKSHVDGMAMINFALERKLPLLHMIGGINMAFAGVGQIAKRAGAVFIRRSFQNDPVYKLALRHYLSYILEKRFPVAWSLEGTRSRIGKLMPPRYGILKYVVEAARRNGIDDLQFVPVSIYYDLIPEIDSYASEQMGATKRKESLSWFIGFVAGMRKPLGRIYMSFGEPVAENDSRGEPGAEDDISRDLHRIAFNSAVSANEATPLTASGALAFIMMSAAPTALTEDEIGNDLLRLKEWAEVRGLPMTSDFEDAKAKKIRKVGAALIETGVLERYDEGAEPVLSVARGKNFIASYYRNTVIHFFVTNALMELALAHAMEADPGLSADAFWRECMALRDLFKFEFFYPTKEEFRQAIEDELDLQNVNWRNQLNAGRKGVEALLEGLSPLVSPGTLKPYAEAYSVVADTLLHVKSGAGASEKEIVNQCLKIGREAVLRQRISGEESIAKFLYSNGYDLACNRGLAEGEADTLAGARLAFAQEMRDVLRRIALVEAIAARRRATSDYGVQEVNQNVASAHAG